MPNSIEIVEGPWFGGCNSVDAPYALQNGYYQWAINAINKGGIVATRPGMRTIRMFTPVPHNPSGIKIFTAYDGITYLVVASGTKVYYNKFPFNHGAWYEVPNVSFSPGKVNFEIGVKGVSRDSAGNITVLERPFPILMMFDGEHKTAFWTGVDSRHCEPSNRECPPCKWGKWIGNRFWIMQGSKIRVSDLLDPTAFTEEDIIAEGGYFNLPDVGTGLGVSADFKSLIAFTDYTTTAFQAQILNRTLWQTTPDFQKVIFYGIGCAAGKSIVNQYGMLWWYSHGGFINLDSAIQTYRSSEARFKDQNMRRSQSNLSNDISGICACAYGNYLLLSVPSGDLSNYHTWVMDRNPNETLDGAAQWAGVWTGIRPTQYATGVVNGKDRCFALSNDLLPDGALATSEFAQTGVWELFLQDKRDIGTDAGNDDLIAKDIAVSLETRFLTKDVYAAAKMVEIEVEEAEGTIQLDISIATRRGVYKNILSKQIVATTGSFTANTIIPDEFIPNVKQRRTERSVNDRVLSNDKNPPVETKLTRNKDKFFSVLVQWTGKMSTPRIRLYLDPDPDAMEGTSTENETTDRYVDIEGNATIESNLALQTPIINPSPILQQQSGFWNISTPRWFEGIYKSLS